MKKLLLLTLIISNIAYSQSFQWAKRGGGNNSISNTTLHRAEEIIKVVTDTNNNIYTISRVTSAGLDVDTNTRPYFDSQLEFDYVLSSFSCDGSYRWSKTIGGQGFETMHLSTDGLGNVYVSGKFGNCQTNTSYPAQIEGDVIISQTPQDCSLIFLVKFNTNGVMQWFKRPQSSSVSISVGFSQTGSLGLEVDSLGNSYWFVAIPPGTYANGAFTSTESTTKFFVFKYDTTGAFVSATLMDFSVSGAFGQTLRFYRNPQTGQYYLTANKYNTGSAAATLGTDTITGSFFIASFDATGQKLWHQQDAASSIGTNFESYDLVTDNLNNIYFAGKINGNNVASFMGVSSSTPFYKSYLIKLNSSGSTVLWGAVADGTGVYESAGLAINGTEIGLVSSCFGPNYTWGTQSMFVSNVNQGTEILFARFNTVTGDCIGLNKIPGDVGYEDNGSSLAVDSSGDYIIGGGFGHHLTINGTTLINEGSQTDFFIAKYATTPCSTASTDNFEKEQGLNFYPNPVNDILTIDIKEASSYTLYNLQGRIIQQGKLSPSNNTMDCSVLDSGCYLLHVIDINNNKQVVKVLKN
jgi:hypothetical protein